MENHSKPVEVGVIMGFKCMHVLPSAIHLPELVHRRMRDDGTLDRWISDGMAEVAGRLVAAAAARPPSPVNIKQVAQKLLRLKVPGLGEQLGWNDAKPRRSWVWARAAINSIDIFIFTMKLDFITFMGFVKTC